MNICYTTNDRFVPKVAASLCSVCENNREEAALRFYILGRDISHENILKLRQLTDAYMRPLTFIPLDDITSYLDFTFDTNGWNPIVLARLLIDRFLPDTVDRVLYLDGDTIVRDSLYDLWATDLGGCILGACIEATCDRQRREQVVGMDQPYINAGVLLIDLNKWRKEDTGRVLLDFYRAHDGRLFAGDQDVINGALLGRIHYLPPRYNFYNIYWFYNYRVLKKLMGKAWYYSQEVYDDSVRHPAIIHYLGEERPWRAGNRHRFKPDYIKYLRMTPWKDDPEEQGWQTYFLCWDIFNALMKPFPMLRYRIINGLIPTVMAWRKKQLQKAKQST